MLRVYLPALLGLAIAMAGAFLPIGRLAGVDVAAIEARYEAVAVAGSERSAPSAHPAGDATIVAAVVADPARLQSGR